MIGVIDELLRRKILIHQDGDGNPISYQISDDVLNFICKNINKDSQTLETGAGVSTILFVL